MISCKEKEVKTDEIILQLDVQKGQKWLSKMSVSQSMEADVNGVFSLIDQNIDFEWMTDMVRDSADIFIFNNQYQKIILTQSQSDDEKEDLMVIDTDELSRTQTFNSELEKYYYQLTKFAYQSQMNRRGEEIKSDLDNLNKMIGGHQFTSPFQSMFQYGVFFPDYALKEKDVWYKEVYFNNEQILISGNVRYQLQTWDDEVAYIQIRSLLKGRHTGFDVEGQIDVEKTGIITIDRSSGWMMAADLEQSVKWLDINSNENRLLGQIKISSTPQ